MPAKAKCGIVEQPIRRTYIAEVAITRGQAVIQGTADNQVKLPGAANVVCLGYAEEDAAIGMPVAIITGGEAIGIASGVIAAGVYVKVSGVTGKLIGGLAAGENIVGRTVHAAAADGDEVVVKVVFGTA